MTAQAPSAAEQATIDRLGIFDEEKFANIIHASDIGPKCEWPVNESDPLDDTACGDTATHITRCRACKQFAKLLCTPHALRVPTDRMPIVHAECGATGPLCEVMGVGAL